MDATEQKLIELGFRKFYHKEFGDKPFWSETDLVKEDENEQWMYNPTDYTKYDKYVADNKGFEDTIMGYEQWMDEYTECDDCGKSVLYDEINDDGNKRCDHCDMKHNG